MNKKILLGIFFVFVGCGSNVVVLELLIKRSPSCGTIVTFTQFLFIAVEGFIFETKFGTKKPRIPLIAYFVMVSLFFLTSVVNNLAFAFKISMPLHLIFRSGSLMCNLVLGMIWIKKRYDLNKYLSVAMITVGICIATIASAGESANQLQTVDKDIELKDFLYWLFGIATLTFALFLSSFMGLNQEIVYKKYGKVPNESMFYNHALPLPIFLFFYQDFTHQIAIFNKSEIFHALLPIPCMWVYIIANMLTQYVCIRSVFLLTTECASLTVTLVVTLRKFTSLIFSIFYFQNPFTTVHWLGTFLVFFGTLIFSDVLPAPGRVFASFKRSKDSMDMAKKKNDDFRLRVRSEVDQSDDTGIKEVVGDINNKGDEAMSIRKR